MPPALGESLLWFETRSGAKYFQHSQEANPADLSEADQVVERRVVNERCFNIDGAAAYGGE